MARILRITFEDNIDSAFDFYNQKQIKAIGKSVRRAINKGVNSQFTMLGDRIRKVRKIKKRDLKRFMKKEKARGNRIELLEGRVRISGRPVGLINFVVGKKSPRDQRGKTFAQRRKLRVQIRPGKKRVLKHAFIARSKQKKATGEPTYQVFQRKTTRRAPIARQAAPGFARLAERANIINPVLKETGIIIRDEFFRQMALANERNPISKKLKRRV